MGLPAGWDVVERMAGTDAARLLKKDWWGFHEISGWISVGSCLGAPPRVLETNSLIAEQMSVRALQDEETGHALLKTVQDCM